MQPVNTGIAYALWCLCAFGFCGGQRLYTGKVASGLLYLFTFGVFGIGQLVDLALIPGMVERRNRYLLNAGGPNAAATPFITLNIGDIPQTQAAPTPAKPVSPMQKLLRAAKDNGGMLSMAQAVMHTELDPKEVKQLLLDAEKHGIAEICNDPQTGAIRYRFDV